MKKNEENSSKMSAKTENPHKKIAIVTGASGASARYLSGSLQKKRLTKSGSSQETGSGSVRCKTNWVSESYLYVRT